MPPAAPKVCVMNNDLAVGGDRSVPSPFLNPALRQALVADSTASPLDLGTILRVLRQWRWVVLGAAIAGLLGGLFITFLTKPMYRASVLLEVNPPHVEILDEKKRDGSDSNSGFDFVITEVGLLSSSSLAERVAQDLNLAANTTIVGKGGDSATRLKISAGAVAGGLKVIPPEQGRLIRFTYDSPSPTLAAQIANGIADSFIGSGLQRKYEASNYARNFLLQQLNKSRGELERGERQLVTYAQSQGIISTGSAVGANSGDVNSLQGASLVTLNGALAEATARRVQAQGAYQQAQLSGGSADVNASTSGLRSARASLEAEYQDKRTLLKPDHPDMLALNARIQEIDRQITRETAQVTSGKNTTLLAQYRGAAAAENNLRSQVAGLKGSVLNLRGRSIQYTILQRDVDTNRALYDALLQRYKEIGIGAGVGTSPVTIVDRAQVPGGPFKPNMMLNLFAGLVIGLLGGIATAILFEYVNDSIKSRADVKNKLHVACLGVIPLLRGSATLLDELPDIKSAVSEAYSAVLAALRFSSQEGTPKALLLTSANPAEGKSSTALALALNYARRGELVLLIDADLRRPAFKSEPDAFGLTNLLTSTESIRPHVLPTQHANFWLLPCGPIAPNPADLLAGQRFGDILREAGELFDRIIVDGPPTLGMADASFLAAFVGNVMLVVESGRTRTRAARDAIDRIAISGSHLLGVTVTKSPEEATRYGYYEYRYGASIGGNRPDMIALGRNDA